MADTVKPDIQGKTLLTPREAAGFLRLNPRTVVRLAREGKIPAMKIGNRWRFQRDALCAGAALVRKSAEGRAAKARPRTGGFSLSEFLRPEVVYLDIAGADRREALGEIVARLEQAGRLKEPDKFLGLLLEREELMATVIMPGVAIPHPRRAAPGMFAESFVVVAVSRQGVNFAAEGAARPVKLFFVICAEDDRSHLRILAGLSRVLKDTAISERLMYAANSDDVISIVSDEEGALPAGD